MPSARPLKRKNIISPIFDNQNKRIPDLRLLAPIVANYPDVTKIGTLMITLDSKGCQEPCEQVGKIFALQIAISLLTSNVT